jgi:hypothetical protein
MMILETGPTVVFDKMGVLESFLQAQRFIVVSSDSQPWGNRSKRGTKL